jgi:Tfp pilus assembly protein PilF
MPLAGKLVKPPEGGAPRPVPKHSPGGYQDLLAAGFLAVMAFLLFRPAVGYEFLNYDDVGYVSANASVLGGLSWKGLKYAVTTGDVGSWAPLTWISYLAGTTLFGTNASAYHATSIVLHIAAGVALFFALRSLLKSFWSPFILAAFFLIHPLRTDSVVWIAERKDVLCALFWALGLWAYSAYGQRPSPGRWTLVFLCFLCGLMSKFMMATFPFVLLLLDFWPLARAGQDWPGLRARVWPLVREKIPFFAAGAGGFWLTSRALAREDSLNPAWTDLGGKILRVPEDYFFYIEKIFWPVRRSILYPLTKVIPSWAAFCAVILAGVTLVAIWKMWRMPWLLVGWLWFLGVLVPVAGFVTFSHFFVADRYAYIPSIGLTLAVVVSLERFSKTGTFRRTACGILAAVALAVCFAATRADLPRWKSSLSLFDAALAIGPHYVAYNSRAMALMDLGEARRALDDFNAAIALQPGLSEAFTGRATAWMALGNYDEAVKDCDRALLLTPGRANIYNNRGNAYSRKGELHEALADYDQALKFSPNNPLYYNNRAAAFYDLKEYAKAKADLEKCRQLGGKPHSGLVEALEHEPGPPR